MEGCWLEVLGVEVGGLEGRGWKFLVGGWEVLRVEVGGFWLGVGRSWGERLEVEGVEVGGGRLLVGGLSDKAK